MEPMSVVDFPSRAGTASPAGHRVPPHNLQAEASLLGAMLLTNEAIADALEVVAADAFYKPANQKIFHAIKSLYGSGEPPADPP